MSIKLETEVAELRQEVADHRRRVETLEATVEEIQDLLRKLTRQSTPKEKAA